SIARAPRLDRSSWARDLFAARMHMVATFLPFLLAAAGQSPSFHRTHPEPKPSECLRCHTGGQGSDTTPPSGPGPHHRCDADACHVKDFSEAKTFEKTTVCLVCHQPKTRSVGAKFVAFPPASPSFYADLSHQRHTDSESAK